jgi:hypothetical protein
MDTGRKNCHFYGTDKGLHFGYKVKRRVKRRLLFEENTLWRDFCIGLGNVFIGQQIL